MARAGATIYFIAATQMQYELALRFEEFDPRFCRRIRDMWDARGISRNTHVFVVLPNLTADNKFTELKLELEVRGCQLEEIWT